MTPIHPCPAAPPIAGFLELARFCTMNLPPCFPACAYFGRRSSFGVTTSLLVFSAFSSPSALGQAAATGAPSPQEPATIVLSPFTVSDEQDQGYQAANTLAGS